MISFYFSVCVCLTEFGDQDEERRVHALLLVTVHVPDERVIFRIWNAAG
jgi:hypothetical protein